MAVLSLVLGLLALLLAIAGMFLAIVPFVGAAASIAAVVCAVVGIVLGARAHSQARSTGEDTTFPVVALVVNVMVFLGSLCVLATCGACNALISSSDHRSGSFVVAGPDGSVQMYSFGADGGVTVRPEPLPPTLDPVPSTAPAPAPGAAPPPALPPPPMDSARPPVP